MKAVFDIMQGQKWNDGVRQMRQLKPLRVEQWGEMLELVYVADGRAQNGTSSINGGLGAEGQERLQLIEGLQLKAIRHKVKTCKRVSKGVLDAWRLVNLAEAEEYDLGLLAKGLVQSGADRVAKSVAKRADIGELPEWDDERTKREIMADPVGACWKYFPKWFFRPPSKMTTSIIEVIWQVILYGGNQSIGVIRGGGKSTITKALITLAGCIGVIKYAVLFGANDKKATKIKKDIVKQLETNDLLLRDFPAACIPIRALEGKSQRAAGQTYMGERTYVGYGTEITQLAQIPGAASSGFMIQCAGIDSGFLGQVDDGVRPDFVLGDDIQNLKNAKSDSYVADLEDTVRQGFEGLGGKESPLRIVLLATCTREGDFSDRVLNPDLYPEYSGLRFGLVEDWGTAEVLWEEYVSLYRKDLRNGDKQFLNATQFYINNRGAMDDGVVVTDPEFYVHGVEQSAIQGAWNARARMGDKGYFAQMENKPISTEASLYSLQASDVCKVLNGFKRTQMPGWCRGVFAFADVGADKLRWCVLSVGSNSRGAIIDYGVWPKRGRVAPKKSTGKALEQCIWRAMDGLRRYWSNTVYTWVGEPQRIVCAGYDRGWEAATVQSYCKAMSPESLFPIIPLRGQGYSQWRDATSKAIKYGWNTQLVHTVEGAAPGDFINVKTDFWKEYVQRSFLVSHYMESGATSLWGRDPQEHGEFADQVCAEVLSDKGRGKNGTEFWQWSLKPGNNNHFLDTLVGCYALAGFYGYLKPESALDDEEQPLEMRAKVRKRTRSKRRKCKVALAEY